MKILWIEDEADDRKGNFLKSTFFNPDKDLVLAGSFEEAETLVSKAQNAYDYIVLDINLEKFGIDKKNEVLSHEFGLSTNEFIKKSGFYFYHKLQGLGFSNDRILFLTGNTNAIVDNENLFTNLKRKGQDVLDKWADQEMQEFSDLLENIMLSFQVEDFSEIEKQQNKFAEGENYEERAKSLQELLEMVKSKLTLEHSHHIKNTYEEFSDYFNKALLPIADSIHKDDTNKFQEWLKKRVKLTPSDEKSCYVMVRRGIIEACQFLRKELREKEEKFILFNETLDRSNKSVMNASVTDVEDFLDKIEQFLPLRQPENKDSTYLRLLRELSHEWERSQGYLEGNRSDPIYIFKNMCQDQMKRLRNYLAHNLIKSGIKDKDVIFFFLLSMRAWFNLDPKKVENYERYLLNVFSDKSTPLTNLNNRLANSYSQFRKEFGRFDEIKSETFPGLMRSVFFLKMDRQVAIRKMVVKLFYQNFFHSLAPPDKMQYEGHDNSSKITITVRFDGKNMERYSDNSFPMLVAKRIFEHAFGTNDRN